LLLAIFVLHNYSAVAFDQKDYKEFSQYVRDLVWSLELPEFKNPQRTDSFNDKSAVILASYEECIVGKKDKVSLATFQQIPQINSTWMYRQMVQINDESALKHYSEFDALAYASRRVPYYGKIEVRTVIGVRVIKPDGSIHEVSTDDYVLSSEGRKDKDGRQRLAVPGLAVGDIIDVFTYRYKSAKGLNPAPIVFSFKDEYPMLSYRVHCEIDNSLSTRYRTLNGAPVFKISRNALNDWALDVRVKNVNETAPGLWYDAMSQTPLTLLYISIADGSTVAPKITETPGIHANPAANLLYDEAWEAWDRQMHFVGLNKKEKAAVKEAMSKYQDQEQRADFLYEQYVAYILAHKLQSYDENAFNLWLASYFNKAGIDFECGITTTNSCEPMDQLISSYNVTRFLRLPSGKCYFPPLFAGYPGEVPSQLQGRQALICTNQNHKLKQGPYKPILLPESKIEDNVDATVIKAQIDGSLMQISRTTKQMGVMREKTSLLLATREELVHSISKNHDQWDGMADLYNKKYANEIQEGIESDREEQKELFRTEITAYHSEAPSSVGDCRVLSVGTTKEEPSFTYQTEYTMERMVKRAGDNIVLAVGQLIGEEIKIEGKDRERSADVCRVAPLLFTWDIEVTLPEGYQVHPEALALLQDEFFNECGSFTASPTAKDGKLYLKVEKRIFHKCEKLEKWPQLVEIYDRSHEFASKQLVLKR